MSIFRSYDVRGIYGKDINEDIMKRIGAAFSTLSTKTIVIANDMRVSSESLKRAFINGSRSVIDVGCVPLGAGMMHALDRYDYAYVTASHLPGEWNGVKFFHRSGIGFNESENKKIGEIFEVAKSVGKPLVKREDTKKVLESYKSYVVGKVRMEKKIHAVLDCGNGMASVVAKDMFLKAGMTAEAIYDKLDGSFPNRDPEPGIDPLTELCQRTKSADIGIAYDGDGDRMVLVDDTGRKLTPEQTSYLILLEAVKYKGPIIANVECTRLIDDIAEKFGKKIVRIPVGHTFLMQYVAEQGACFGLEVSGHYALPYMAPIDDSLMVSIYAAYVLSKQQKKLSEIVDEIKTYPFERLSFDCSDEKKFLVVEKLRSAFRRDYEKVSVMDGVRVDFPDGWVLIRASNTAPIIRLTVEGMDKKAKERIKKNFSKLLESAIDDKRQ